MYRSPFCVIIYTSYKFSKMVELFGSLGILYIAKCVDVQGSESETETKMLSAVCLLTFPLVIGAFTVLLADEKDFSV